MAVMQHCQGPWLGKSTSLSACPITKAPHISVELYMGTVIQPARRETKVDLRNTFSREHLFLSFMCKQLPWLDDLVFSFCAISCKDHFCGDAVQELSSAFHGDNMKELAKS